MYPAVTNHRVAVEAGPGGPSGAHTSNRPSGALRGDGRNIRGGSIMSRATALGRRRTTFWRLPLAVALTLGALGGSLVLGGAAPAGAAGSPTQVAFTTNPSAVVAGATMTAPVVQLRDSGNNNVAQAGVTVSLALSAGSFDPSSTTSTTTNASGQAVFSNLVFDTAGSFTITASSPGLTSKTSSSFTVSAGAVSQIALSSVPASVVSGAALGIVGTAQDAYGNKVSTLSTGTVALSVATGPTGGALAGTTSRTFSGGVVTFSAASLTTVGSYTLTASYTDPTAGLLTATTGQIAVTVGAAKKLGFTQGPTTTVAGAVMSPAPTVQVEDANGNAVADAGVSVTLTSTGTLTSGSTKIVTTDANGVATFSNLVWNTGGSYTIAASASGLTASGNSGSFTITAGSPVTLAFTTQPVTTNAGSTIPTTVVKIEDSLGNVVTSSSDPVTLTPNGPGGFDPGATSTVSAVNGVATFSNLILDQSGSYTLSATSTDGAVGTSHSFTISALAATRIVFSQGPVNGTAGTVQSPNVVVQAQDQYGNVATTATGTVTLAASPSVTLTSGTKALSSGVATFSALAIQTAGTYTLTASLPGFTSAVSGSFTIAANVPYQLVYGTQPTSITAGQLFSPSPTVLVEDRYGNVETTDSTDTVTLTGSVAAGSTATETVSSGIATFDNLTIDLVGNVNHTLAASSATTPALRTATSASFVVSPGAPYSLDIAQPQLGGQIGTGNSVGAFYLEQFDQYGNNTWGTSGTPLTFSSSSPGGTFSLTDGGPSTTTANFVYPPNNNTPPNNRYLYFYYGDTNVGLPTITVSSPGVLSGTQQVQMMDVQSPGDQTDPTGSAITPLTITGQDSSPASSFTSWSATGLPPGLSIDNTGTVTGTPTATGSYSVEVYGYEGVYAYGYAGFTWTIGNTVTVADPGAQTDTTGSAISPVTVTGTDSAGETLSYADNGTLPPGLSIDASTGVISGTPTATGTTSTTITATDTDGFTGTTTFNWTIGNTVTVAGPGAQTDVSGSPIGTVTVTGTDSASETLTWSANGTLPAGLSINATTGVISGTPTTAGTTSTTVTATDTDGFTGSTTFAWTIHNAVTVANPGTHNDVVGTAVTPFTPSATDSSSTATISSWSATGLPAGLTLTPSTGRISGTPTTACACSVVLSATDSAGASGSATFTWNVTANPNAPTITALNHTSGPTAGGVKVRITGSRMQGATQVLFGSVPGTNLHWNRKGTKLIVTTPAQAAGVVDVIVRTPGGSSVPTAGDRYTYVAPTITSVSPRTGPAAGGGKKIRIYGSDLQGATAVHFGPTSAAFTVNPRGTVIVATLPPGTGTVDITVTCPGGTSATGPADQFSYIG